jgi:hypothetical protein
LQRLAEQPLNKRRQDAVATLLATKGHQVPRFGEEIERAVRDAFQDHSVTQVMTNVYGTAWVGTVTMVGRDQIIYQGDGGDTPLSVFGRAGAGPKLLMINGSLISFVGLGMFAYFVLSFTTSVIESLQMSAPPRLASPVPWVP